MSVFKTLYSALVLFMLFFIMVSNVSAGSSTDIHTAATPWKQRPRQFRMMVYSRPYKKGTVQNLRTSNGGSPPCWNLASKRVGSFEVNDPLVKVTFYRASDCHGAPSATYKGTSRINDHVLIKAGSVSITKMRPLMLKDQHHDL